MKISQTYRTDSAPQRAQVSAPTPDAMCWLNRSRVYARSVRPVLPRRSKALTATRKRLPPISGVIGKVQSFTGSSLDVQTPSGVVHVDVKQPLTTYKQVPSDLSHVTPASYVGVASTEQADGKEVAKQIIIFPAELSGAAEGSVLTDPPGATHSQQNDQWLSLSSCRIALAHDERHGTERQRHHPGGPVSGRL